MTRTHSKHVIVGAAALFALGGACSDDAQDAIQDDIESGATDVSTFIDDVGRDAAELAARNVASTQGLDEFEQLGYAVVGGLTCEADASDSATSVEIVCTGITDDEQVVEMTGTTSELPGESIDELRGAFVGTIDGEEVFSVDTLGD